MEKEDVVIGYQITAPNGDIYAVFVNADEKAREFNLGTAFAQDVYKRQHLHGQVLQPS